MPAARYRFGPYELDLPGLELRRAGRPIALLAEARQTADELGLVRLQRSVRELTARASGD